MANKAHLALFNQGLDVWNKWRNEHMWDEADLRGLRRSRRKLMRVDFREVMLDGACLRGTRLDHAWLYNAYLMKADLRGANLSFAKLGETFLNEADLRGANLTGADLTGADLTGADLRGANLAQAFFCGANLSGTDLSHAKCVTTTFVEMNLSSAKGLVAVEHHGPSFIGIDTIYKSKGNIPELFLRGAGVPENFITFMYSLTERAFDFYSCFISHSNKDKLFCERLYNDLQAKGIRTWYFPESAQWGNTVWGEIDRSIKVYDKLIVVCSKNSLNSNPVMREIERALNREDKERKNILFPITLDNYVFEGWEHPRKVDLLNRVIGSFHGWNRDATKYDAAFQKLLKALRAVRK